MSYPRVGHLLAAVVLAFATATGRGAEVVSGGHLEVAFSPAGGAEELVLRVLGSARHSIRMLSYTFTSRPVARALAAARRRGVDVAVVADTRSNLEEDRGGLARSALSELVRAGCDVRMISAFPLQHDKLMIVDEVTTELGSYNYTASANSRNSETMLVVWDNPGLARQSLQHFERNYALAVPFASVADRP